MQCHENEAGKGKDAFHYFWLFAFILLQRRRKCSEKGTETQNLRSTSEKYPQGNDGIDVFFQ